MATTYATIITNMYTVPNPTGYVVNVLFTVTGTDGTYLVKIGGNITFTPEQGEAGFVPYDQLTQDEVIGWINSATDNQAMYYTNIDGQLNSLVNPPVPPENTPLPWGA